MADSRAGARKIQYEPKASENKEVKKKKEGWEHIKWA